MTSIQGCGRTCKEHISKSRLGSSLFPKSNHDKTPVKPPTIKFPIAKYTEEDLHRILKTVFEAWAPPFDGTREKLLKARLPNVYRESPTWNAITFVSSVRITLPAPEPRAPTVFPL